MFNFGLAGLGLIDFGADSVDDIRKLKEVFNDSIVSIVKYGFGKRNILVVLNSTSMEYLLRIKPYVMRLMKSKNILVLSRKNIIPKNLGVDFLNLKLTSVVIYGEDVFKDVKFDNEKIRRQIRYEANRLLISTRNEMLARRWQWSLRENLYQAVPRVLPLIVAHLYLEEEKIPNAIPDTINKYLKYNEDAAVLLKINKDVGRDEMYRLYGSLFTFLENLAEKV